jgi:hypothetical protein
LPLIGAATMTGTAYAAPVACAETTLPKLWNPGARSVFGDVVLFSFLLAQCLDGVFTYVGVVSYGATIEANPLIASLMVYLGHGAALLSAKSVAGLLGIALHLRGVHRAVAALTLFYVAVAVLPWIAILFG